MRRFNKWPVSVFAVSMMLGVSACSPDDPGGVDFSGSAEHPRKVISLFDPVAASPQIPFPVDLLFNGAPENTDGTLNIPNASNAPFVDHANLLDGFSTVASLFTDVLGDVDMTSANSGAVLVINTKTLRPLAPGVDYRVERSTVIEPATGRPLDSLRSRLLIEPLKPLDGATTYLVVVTRALTGTDGGHAEPADLFRVLLSEKTVTEQWLAGTEPALKLTNDTQRATLETIRGVYQAQILPGLAAAGIAKENLVIAWPFTTQTVRKTLARLQQNVESKPLTLINIGKTTQDLIEALPPVADVYVGSIELPYYLADATPGADDARPEFQIGGEPDNPLNTFWRADPNVVSDGTPPSSLLAGIPCAGLPKKSVSTTGCFPQPLARAPQRVPVLVTVPNANSGKTMPESGWPVVVFQHGITGNRSQMLPLAPALAAAGFAVVSIDLPLHGLPPGDALRAVTDGLPAALKPTERTFDLNLVNNDTGAPPADDVADPSGTHFINLSSLITSRDNVRQAEADLMTLTASIGDAMLLAPTGNAENPLAPLPIKFSGTGVRHVGHSLGGIVTSAFLGVHPDKNPAVLAMAGGGIGKLLDGSASFGPRIAAGLKASGVVEGTDTYETFLRFAQTLVDDGDPINYAAAAGQDRALLLLEVNGDAVVPNCTIAGDEHCPATDTIGASSWLGGTDPLARALGLEILPGAGQGFDVPIAPEVRTGVQIKANVRFNQGDHGSILSPAANPLVTCEMQTQTATFLASGGQQLPIGTCAGN
ncbi:hypothetical protein [Sinimarinibacterium sp. NLF-5-8]|uniref:hypothetical protein n=1 Tax=Sinimarinibacterium sp. NLF-5-8 TaxID=2698684 RepID=UPI001EE3F7DC|nr:hypothetical protein [Sinimarinibacterium sp. NLF-5-8]